MKFWLLAISLFLGSNAAIASENYVCATHEGSVQFSDQGDSLRDTQAAVMDRCADLTGDPAACAQARCQAASQSFAGLNTLLSTANKKCDSDADCKGFANRCFARQCTQPGYGCESDADCPGFANRCFARKCTRQEPLCNSDKDCKGFANRCFAGKCTNP